MLGRCDDDGGGVACRVSHGGVPWHIWGRVGQRFWFARRREDASGLRWVVAGPRVRSLCGFAALREPSAVSGAMGIGFARRRGDAEGCACGVGAASRGRGPLSNRFGESCRGSRRNTSASPRLRVNQNCSSSRRTPGSMVAVMSRWCADAGGAVSMNPDVRRDDELGVSP